MCGHSILERANFLTAYMPEPEFPDAEEIYYCSDCTEEIYS